MYGSRNARNYVRKQMTRNSLIQEYNNLAAYADKLAGQLAFLEQQYSYYRGVRGASNTPLGVQLRQVRRELARVHRRMNTITRRLYSY